MLRFLIKRNLSTLSTVMVLLWIFILPFLESWWSYIRLFRETMPISRIVLSFYAETAWYRTYLSRSLLMADSIVLSGNFLQ